MPLSKMPRLLPLGDNSPAPGKLLFSIVVVIFVIAMTRPVFSVLLTSLKISAAERPALLVISYANWIQKKSSGVGLGEGASMGSTEGVS